jgi:S1-C subfamily serine protease
MRSFIVKFLWSLLLIGVTLGCRTDYYDGRLRSLPDRPWPCSYVWPGFQKDEGVARLTKPICREAPPERAIRAVLDSTVIVYVYRYDEDRKEMVKYVGTGTVIGTDGTVVTANHIIRKAKSVHVAYRTLSADGRAYGFGPYIVMRIIAKTARYDAAVLRPINRPDHVPPALKVCRRRLSTGDTLWHVGDRIAWSVGTVGQSPLDFKGSNQLIMVHGFGYITLGHYGDSGGPVFDRTGHLLGLYVAIVVSRPMIGRGVVLDAAFTAMNFHAQFESCD